MLYEGSLEAYGQHEFSKIKKVEFFFIFSCVGRGVSGTGFPYLGVTVLKHKKYTSFGLVEDRKPLHGFLEMYEQPGISKINKIEFFIFLGYCVRIFSPWSLRSQNTKMTLIWIWLMIERLFRAF